MPITRALTPRHDSSSLARRAITIAAYLVIVWMNWFAEMKPLNGQTTSELSARFRSQFTPAGYVFSIWSVIYLGLFAFAWYQALVRHREDLRMRAIALPFWISCACNVAWLVCFHYELYLLSFAVIAGLLVSLVLIYGRLSPLDGVKTRGERWCVDVPFRIYTAWVSIATLANLTLALEALGVPLALAHPSAWAIVMLIVAISIASVVGATAHDPWFLAVFVWAFTGIAVRVDQTRSVAVIAMLCAFVTMGWFLRALFWNHTHRPLRPAVS